MTALDLPVRLRPDERQQVAASNQKRSRRWREYGLFALLVAPDLLVIGDEVRRQYEEKVL